MDSSSLFLPEILLVASIMAIPALHIFTENRRSYSICANVSLMGAFIFLVLSWYYPDSLSMDRHVSTYIFYNHFKVDAFSQLFKIVFVLSAFIVSIVSTSYFDESEPHQPEYFTLLLSSTLGMMITASANDYLTLFLGIEISAFSSYAMVAFRKNDDKSTEAGAKYLLIGAFSSGLTLYGISLIYAVTGTLTFDGVHSFVAGLNSGVVDGDFGEVIFIACLFITAGLGFKIAVVPFHAWAPDVYQGAPTPVTTLLAAASKAMGFVAIFRAFTYTLESASEEWALMLGIIALASMTLGNLAAISQDDIGRMLAYSSIAQAGYIMIAIPALTQEAMSGAIAHTLVHAFMKGGAFVIVGCVGAVGLGYDVKSFKGLAKRSQLLALSMTICLLSLVGIPPFAGFISKFFLFYGTLKAGIAGDSWLIVLVIGGVLNSALSLYYYLRIMRYMYLYDPEDSTDIVFPNSVRYVSFGVILILAVVFPWYWDQLYGLCEEAALALLG